MDQRVRRREAAKKRKLARREAEKGLSRKEIIMKRKREREERAREKERRKAAKAEKARERERRKAARDEKEKAKAARALKREMNRAMREEKKRRTDLKKRELEERMARVAEDRRERTARVADFPEVVEKMSAAQRARDDADRILRRKEAAKKRKLARREAEKGLSRKEIIMKRKREREERAREKERRMAAKAAKEREKARERERRKAARDEKEKAKAARALKREMNRAMREEKKRRTDLKKRELEERMARVAEDRRKHEARVADIFAEAAEKMSAAQRARDDAVRFREEKRKTDMLVLRRLLKERREIKERKRKIEQLEATAVAAGAEVAQEVGVDPAARRKVLLEKYRLKKQAILLEKAISTQERKTAEQAAKEAKEAKEAKKAEKKAAKEAKRAAKEAKRAAKEAKEERQRKERENKERERERAKIAKEAEAARLRAAREENRRIKIAEARLERQLELSHKKIHGEIAKIALKQTQPGFVEALQRAAVKDELKLAISCPREGAPGAAFAYQEFVSYAMGPNSPCKRLLCVHRTGAGKTLTIIKILENNFNDPRPKILVFPNRAVALNFYSEILEFPNVYREFLESEFSGDKDLEILRRNDKKHPRFSQIIERVENALGLVGKLKTGKLPSPLRAYSYSELGGTRVFGSNSRDPLFKTPGLSNKIILMDEAHNLISPGNAGCGAHCSNLLQLQKGLFEAENATVCAFTATPITASESTADLLMFVIRGKDGFSPRTKPMEYKEVKQLAESFLFDFGEDEDDRILKGKHLSNISAIRAIEAKLAKQRNEWTGFVSYFYSQPTSTFPEYMPQKCQIIDMANSEALNKRYTMAVAKIDITKTEPKNVVRLQNYCNATCGPTLRPRRAKEWLASIDPSEACPKFVKIAAHVIQSTKKTLIIIDRKHNLVVLAELINQMGAQKTGQRCDGEKCWWAKMIDAADDEADDDNTNQIVARNKKILGVFNSKENDFGQKIKCLLIDAKTYSEGVSFFGVRELHIVNPAVTYALHLQRVGRVFRSCRFVNESVDLKKKVKTSKNTLKRLPDLSPQYRPLRIGGDDRRLKIERFLEKRKIRLAAQRGEEARTKTLKQKIAVYMWMARSDDVLTADEFAFESLLKSKDQFVKQMGWFENASIDKGLYDKWDKVKTGQEALCKAGEADEDEMENFDQRAENLRRQKIEKERKRQAQEREERQARRLNN